jgi:sugar phosphate isomerase/epimerase
VVRRLADFVRDSQRRYPGLTITVENHWGLSTDIDRHLQIIDEIARRLPADVQARFGCCFDPANMPESSERARWWRELAPRANHYHLKTTSFEAPVEKDHLPHATLFALLHETGYSGRVTIESAGEGSATAGVQRSARLFEQYGAHFLA